MSNNGFLICFILHYGIAVAYRPGIENTAYQRSENPILEFDNGRSLTTAFNGRDSLFHTDQVKKFNIYPSTEIEILENTELRHLEHLELQNHGIIYKRSINMPKFIEVEENVKMNSADIRKLETNLTEVVSFQQSLLKELQKLNSNQQVTNTRLTQMNTDLQDFKTSQRAEITKIKDDIRKIENDVGSLTRQQKSFVKELNAIKKNSNASKPNPGLPLPLPNLPVPEGNADLERKIEKYLANITSLLEQSILNELNAIKRNQQALDTNQQLTNNKVQGVIKDLEEIKRYQQTSVSQNSPHKDGDCGGVLVAERGIINYRFDPTLNETIRCVWTVRANKRSKVTFKLLDDQLDNNGNSFITLSPYYNVYSIYTSAVLRQKYTEQILPQDDDEYTVDGPLVFVTFYFTPLEYTRSTRNSFQLQFVGTNVSILESTSFSHYHYNGDTGLVTWPKFGEVYSPNTTVTFVVNPKPVNISIDLSYLRIENSPDCRGDSLTFLKENNVHTGFPYYTLHGPPESNYRYCSDTQTSIKPIPGSNRFIVIFNSHEAKQGYGFQFSWKRTQ